MARYIVQRTFPNGLTVPINGDGAQGLNGVVKNNAEEGVTWQRSFVSADKTKTFCVYDGPSPEAIRKVAQKNGHPVDAITEVRVLDPYFYF